VKNPTLVRSEDMNKRHERKIVQGNHILRYEKQEFDGEKRH